MVREIMNSALDMLFLSHFRDIQAKDVVVRHEHARL